MSKRARHKGRASRKEYSVRFRQCGRRLNEARVDREASLLDVVFPGEYRLFMLRRNGGEPEPGFFVYRRKERGELQLSWVSSVYPITGSQIDVLNLRGANRVLGERAIHWGVPYDCITIGYNGPGDALLLFVRGRRRGQVWIKVWDDVSQDPDLHLDTDPKEGLYRLAASFDRFLAMLCTEEEADRRVNKRP